MKLCATSIPPPYGALCVSLLGSSPFASTQAYPVLFIHKQWYFIALILSHACAIIILFLLILFAVCPHITKRGKEQACFYEFFDYFEIRKIGYRRQGSEVVTAPPLCKENSQHLHPFFPQGSSKTGIPVYFVLS